MNEIAELPTPIIGIGDPDAIFEVYIANRPNFTFTNFDSENESTPITLVNGDIEACSKACGNGWRKVFNVYAKLIFGLSSLELLNPNDYKNWQDYRDHKLLQKDSRTVLIFSPPSKPSSNSLKIIMGRTYGKSLFEQKPLKAQGKLHWLTEEFAVNFELRTVICPYFDYRQLSNAKILYLVDLINKHFPLCSNIKLR
jgi:hypothetical protein